MFTFIASLIMFGYVVRKRPDLLPIDEAFAIMFFVFFTTLMVDVLAVAIILEVL